MTLKEIYKLAVGDKFTEDNYLMFVKAMIIKTKHPAGTTIGQFERSVNIALGNRTPEAEYVERN